MDNQHSTNDMWKVLNDLSTSIASMQSDIKNMLSFNKQSHNDLREALSDIKKNHADHEQRIRLLEKITASKEDVLKVHTRVDKLQTRIWQIVVYLAAGGAATGGSIALFRAFAVGG